MKKAVRKEDNYGYYESGSELMDFAMNKIHEAAFLVDENACFHYINENACQILGYSRDEFRQITVADIDQDFPAERWTGHWNDLQLHGSLLFEGRHKSKDGRIFPVEINANYFEYKGQSYNLALVRDITERKRTEEMQSRMYRELRAISNCNQTLLHAADEQTLLSEICRIICDEAEYRLAWVEYSENDEAKTIRPVAWSGSESSYIETARLSWSDETDRGRGPAGNAIRTGNVILVQDFNCDPQMTPWKESALKHGYRSGIALPLKDENAKVFGVLLIYSSEKEAITHDEMRLLEDLSGDLADGIISLRTRNERKKAEESLKQSGLRLNEAQHVAHIGNWELDLVKNVLIWSDEIYLMFEIDPKHFDASYEAFLDTIHPDDRDLVNSTYTTSVKNKTPYSIDHRLLFPDGRIKHVHEQCVTLYDINGDPLRSIGTVQDITTRKRAEEVIYKLNQELEQRVDERTSQMEAANRELEAFAYSVSHDLRAPLRGIDRFSLILLEEYQDNIDEQGKNYLRRVRLATQRMAQLIDDMLNLSRVSRSEMNIQPVNLSKIALEIATTLSSMQPERQVEFIIPEGIIVQGDNRLLRIVLENLIGNSWKFTSKHPTATIEFGLQQQNEKSVYFIRDDGAGFEMKHAQKLFGAFQRLHTATEFPGIGVGLATVQRVIHRHGGSVWAEGEVEKGTTFYFTIP
ncbi:MAG: PAS domain S-box protein [Bacteroidetes bacterium]|nr:PAS domain S-box protein [Bacteroidota bacterium]